MGTILTILGVVLQVLGLFTAGTGLWKTWHEFAEGEGFWYPFVARARRLYQRSLEQVRRVLRRQQHVDAQAGFAQVGFSVSGRGRVTWGELPKTTKPAIAELDRRLRLVWERLSDVTDRHDDELVEIRKLAASIEGEVKDTAEQVRKQTRRVAIGGVRYEALGLFLVALGLLLQGAGAVVPS